MSAVEILRVAPDEPELRPVGLTRYGGISARFEIITPAIAAEMLATNTHNRHMKTVKLRAMTNAIVRGEWDLNGETCKVSKSGVLLDGQHRLRAIQDSGITVAMLVVRGLPDVAQETIDQTTKRTLGDVLTLRGEKSATTIAAALAQLHLYWTTGRLSHVGGQAPTMQQALLLLERHPGLRLSVAWGYLWNSHLRFIPGTATAIHYLCSQVDSEDADTFFETVARGTGLAEGDPRATLRRALEVDALAPVGGKMQPLRKAAITIRAFNGWRAGETLTKLQWSPGGTRPDRFPVPA